PAYTTLAVGELVHLEQRDRGHWEDDELGDAHPGLDGERLVRVGVEEDDAELSPVPRVDETGRVDDCDAVARRKARTRLHEPRVPVGNRDGKPCADQRTISRRERDAVACRQVEACITWIRLTREDCVL